MQFTAGLRSGEDMEFGLRMWFGGGRIEMGRPDAAVYVVGEDAVERVTAPMLPLREEFRALLTF